MIRALALAAALVVAAPDATTAQRKKKAEEEGLPAVDPYTGNDLAALRAAGYVSYGPFPWGDGHDSGRIEDVLGFSLLWAETAHFRIGSSLPEYVPEGDRKEKDKLRAELARLAERLPGVNPKARRLDPWLRLHLTAQRLEDLYAEFSALCGVTDADFPESGGDPPGPDTPYMGQGPYLGQPAKYTVLLTEKPSTLERYAGHFLGLHTRLPVRHNGVTSGSLFFGTCLEYMEGYETDAALHAFMVLGVSSNLLEGLRFYGQEPPLWLREGLAHWFGRRVDPRWSVWTERRIRKEDAWKWEPRVRGRVEHEIAPPWEDMLAWRTPDDLGSTGAMIAWSRVDFLLSRADGAARFLLAIKDSAWADDSLRVPPETQARLLEECYGMDLAAMDRAWCEYVLDSYDKR